ncbi:MAG: PAS domain S-box protein, partial [Deltaproteobacteria bacterium]|nr:PAS domain S-box protein [Deltaproteobacteria bacterium]
MPSHSPAPPAHAQRSPLALAGLWTALLAGFTALMLHHAWQDELDQVHQRATGALHKDLAYRVWASHQGGVYVPVTEHTPPNPYLAHLPDRDVWLPDGRVLTLVNPAYMTRQAVNLSAELYGIQGHLTSLKPIRPENAPRPWEVTALEQLEAGLPEFAVVQEGWYHLMMPLHATESCLKCHSAQGCQEGDLRGGLSTSIPLQRSVDGYWRRVRETLLTMGGLWILGLMGIGGAEWRWRHSSAQQMRLERALRLSEFSQSHSSEAVLWFGPAGRVLEVNAAAESLSGYSRAELVGMDLTRFHMLPPDQAWAMLRGRGTLHRRGTFPRRDGTQVEVEITVALLSLGAEELASATLLDISERLRQERRLAEAHRFLQAVLDHAPDPMVVIGPDFRILRANQRYLALSEEPPDSREPNTCYRQSHGFSSPCTGDDHPCPLRLSQETKAPVKVVHKHQGAGGTVQYMEILTAPLFDEHGALTHLIETFRDITDRVEAERERRDMAEQVQKAQRLESLAVMAGGVAHDFNNLLVGILGVADGILLELPDNAPHREELETIIQTAQNAAALANQMLAYSGRGSFNKRPIDLNEAVGEMVRVVEAGDGVKVLSHLSPQLPAVMADPTQIRQVILNLLTNAREAGATQIEVETEDHTERRIRLTVRDNGGGMTPALVERIFEPFFTTKFTGRGLGMSVVQGVIRGHGGGIEVQSALGEGSTFTLTLPALQGRGPEEAPAALPLTLPEPQGELLLERRSSSSVQGSTAGWVCDLVRAKEAPC